MLVLQREPEQSILIGEDIVVTVLRIEHGRVRLGIDAPRDVQIIRDDAVRTEERA
jgi:carbon storage regulator